METLRPQGNKPTRKRRIRLLSAVLALLVLAGIFRKWDEPAAAAGREIDSGSTVNEKGWRTVVSEAPGYQNLVTVYDGAGQKRFEWYCASDFVLRAVLSPDCKTLAVVTVGTEGGKLRRFSPESESAQGEYAFGETIVYDLGFFRGKSLCALGETDIFFFSPDGELSRRIPLEGAAVRDYSLTRRFAEFSLEREDGGCSVVRYNSRGRRLFSGLRQGASYSIE